MTKEQIAVKDILHLYLGCEVETPNGIGILISVGDSERGEDCIVSIQNNDEESGFYGEWTDYTLEHHVIKPRLRQLSSMAEEEFREVLYDEATEEFGGITFTEQFKNAVENINIEDVVLTPHQTKYLLSKHFDLFDLIPSGLAIDATTINNLNQKPC
jgi:hypothetical protein